jgi:hypothetical protein
VIAYFIDGYPKITGSSIVFIKPTGIFLPTVAVKKKYPWVLAFGPYTCCLESSKEFRYLLIGHR